MLQFDKSIWTPRFLLLASLTLVGQIILGIIVSLLLGFSSAQTELVMTVFLFISGIIVLDWLREPTPRKIVLGAGFFVLIALLFLSTSSVLQTNITGRQPNNLLQQSLYVPVFTLALVVFLGWLLSPRTKRMGEEEILDQPAYWFARLCHIALAGIAGIELLLQSASGSRLQLLPFANTLTFGITLNTVFVWLLGLLLITSLLRLRNPLTFTDSVIILVLGALCSLFQYTFGSTELIRFIPTLSRPLSNNINLVLSIIPLALAILALFAAWSRVFTPLWLTLQLFFLQPFLPLASARPRVTSLSPNILIGQVFTFILAIVLLLLILRLLYYGDRRQLNPVDAVTVTLIALMLLFTLWSAGQIAIASVIGLFLLLAFLSSYAYLFFHSRFPWLQRVMNIVHILLVLSITVGGLLMLNSVGNSSTYIAAETLNPHRWNASLTALPIRNQYVLDVFFALMLLLYIIGLVRQRWDRSFAHSERMLIFLSGGVCWLVLAGGGRQALLPLVATNLQQIGNSAQSVFTAESVAALCVLLAALISLLWLLRTNSLTERILLTALFVIAALCALLAYLTGSPLLLLIALPIMLAGILIATRSAYMQTHPVAPAPAVSS
ncbi:hypothetical protein KSF_072580 [Reticulibacter mediterranei]|uniref:Uncharacterized protein n=1 Tax=Reticulibacter mediterranei TaxID=2778369 RepID=A0A8J3N6A3_9CHLR|nr:hypothetical protein [Reticulibacter mediterranei]GHO97210.1 hypothetical protein KSF_072580 [Reticulibacter mediterranei]